MAENYLTNRFYVNAGRNPNLARVDQRLLSIMSSAASYLPDGYRVVINEGYNAHGHAAKSQHHVSGSGALDLQIVGPRGPIPNKGADTTGLYRQLAQHAYGVMLASHPELKGKFAWGGSFGTVSGGRVPDLMHFDIGGERGNLAPHLSAMGPVSGQNYTGHPVPSEDIQNVAPSSATLHKGMGGPAVDQLGRQLGDLGYNTGTPRDQFGPATAKAVHNFEKGTGGFLNVDKGIAGPQVQGALADIGRSGDIMSVAGMPGVNAGAPAIPDANPLDFAFGRSPSAAPAPDFSIANPNPPGQRLQEGAGVVTIPTGTSGAPYAGERGRPDGSRFAFGVPQQLNFTPAGVSSDAPPSTFPARPEMRGYAPPSIYPDPNTFALNRRSQERQGAARGTLDALRAASAPAGFQQPNRPITPTPPEQLSIGYDTGDAFAGSPAMGYSPADPALMNNYGSPFDAPADGFDAAGHGVAGINNDVMNAAGNAWNFIKGAPGAAVDGALAFSDGVQNWLGGSAAAPAAAAKPPIPPAVPNNDYQGYIPGGYGIGRQDPQQLGYGGGYPQYASAAPDMGGWRAPITPPSPAMGSPAYNIIGNTMGIPQTGTLRHQGDYGALPAGASDADRSWAIASADPNFVPGTPPSYAPNFSSDFSPPSIAGYTVTAMPDLNPAPRPPSLDVSINGSPEKQAADAWQRVTEEGATGGPPLAPWSPTQTNYGGSNGGGWGGWGGSGGGGWGGGYSAPQAQTASWIGNYFGSSGVTPGPYTGATAPGYNAPNFNPISGGSTFAWNPSDRTYINSYGQKMSMDN